MTYSEFIDLVRKMRGAQKEYFKTRDKYVLEKSKALERQVDKALAEGISLDNTPGAEYNEQQGHLF